MLTVSKTGTDAMWVDDVLVELWVLFSGTFGVPETLDAFELAFSESHTFHRELRTSRAPRALRSFFPQPLTLPAGGFENGREHVV